jgi:hypothetical protein
VAVCAIAIEGGTNKATNAIGEADMTDQQFKAIITHLRIMIVFLGITAGAVITIAWESFNEPNGVDARAAQVAGR